MCFLQDRTKVIQHVHKADICKRSHCKSGLVNLTLADVNLGIFLVLLSFHLGNKLACNIEILQISILGNLESWKFGCTFSVLEQPILETW